MPSRHPVEVRCPSSFVHIQPIVIGTAGHIDHGKSSLVQALTGTDPDRWAEEKDRGMTIDLGFARLVLPDGRHVGLVDVPGHERFVRNMVAGATGIDLVVLVVAADDGVMPQTREHLAIMNMLGVRRGLVALNKIDLVDEEVIELAEEDVRETVEGTFLEGAPVLRVSAVTGQGLDALKSLLIEMAMSAEPRADDGVFRMPIQRVFSARGFGTIVTGIPVSGSISVGDSLELLPAGNKGKVRGLQAYHDAVQTARAGHSTAINLTDTDHHAVKRGMVVASPGFFRPVSMVGANLRALPGLERPVTNRMPVRVHTGTAEAVGEVVLLNSEAILPGEEGLVQFRLDEPLVCAPGDRFVLRLASPVVTLGGGTILEESRYRLKRFKGFVIDELERQASSIDSPLSLLGSHLMRAPERWASESELAVALKRAPAETAELLGQLAQTGDAVHTGPGDRWMHAEVLKSTLDEVRSGLGAWFGENPHRTRIDVRDLRTRTKTEGSFLGMLLGRLKDAGEVLLEAGGKVGLAGREAALGEAEAKLRDAVLAHLAQSPFQPPTAAELCEALKAKAKALDVVLELMMDHGDVARIGPGLLLSTKAQDEARAAVIENCQANGQLEIPALRDRLGTSRKYLIPLLESFDAEGLTMRQGGTRVLRRK